MTNLAPSSGGTGAHHLACPAGAISNRLLSKCNGGNDPGSGYTFQLKRLNIQQGSSVEPAAG